MKAHFKKYNAYVKRVLSLFLAMLLLACENLEVETPKHLLSGVTVYDDSKTVEAAIVGIYANLRDNVLLTGNANGLSNLMGNYTDEIEYVSPYGLPDEQFYKNSLNATNQTVADIWNGSYSQIYTANAILEGVATSTKISQEEREAFVGEALFCRALLHFYLLNLYGDIPYISTTDYTTNQDAPKLDEAEVYALIIDDLLAAYGLLPEMDDSGQHLRPTKYVVAALLARVYLFTEQWQLAQEYATQVIENHGWESEIQHVFLNTSASTLWQFAPNMEGDPTHEAITFLVLFPPPSERVLNPDLLAVYEDGDLRKQNWIAEISDGSQTWYYAAKYKIGLGENNTQEYSIIFRMAEQFLIRAEARARLGDIAGAQIDLNQIRLRAGIAATTANSQAEVLDAILTERQRELFTEHGHRFFDLKRTEHLDMALAYKPGWNTTDKLFPLPEREILINPNLLPQNPGY